ncbi:MAG TPA: RraA family protein [Gemmataceae bacterium]|nr:RraA family protein [Gemmataceae bacterium]
MSTPAVTAADLDLLRRYDTPTVCNVIELFELYPRTAGYMDRRIQACYPKLPPMVGFASTATFRSAASAWSGGAYSGLVEQVESFAQMSGPPVVVFQDIDNPPVAATFGEVMASTYKAFGAVGLITSGAGRDLDQVEALQFPCFCDGIISAHGYCHFPQINVPVHVGGVTVYPGDLLHGDRNGVTTIPLAIASLVAHACAEFMAAEAVVLDYLKTERPDPKGYAKARNECRDRIDALARRLKR